MLLLLLNFIIIYKRPNLQNKFIFSYKSFTTNFHDFLFEKKMGE